MAIYQIYIDGDVPNTMFRAIDALPFSEELREKLGAEIHASFRGGWAGWTKNPDGSSSAPSFLGLFHCAGPETLPTGDLIIRYRLSRAGELVMAAFRELAPAAEIESRHSCDPSVGGDDPRESPLERHARTIIEALNKVVMTELGLDGLCQSIGKCCFGDWNERDFVVDGLSLSIVMTADGRFCSMSAMPVEALAAQDVTA